MGSAVALRTCTFDSPNYVCLRLPCTDVQHTLATGHAEHMHGKGLLFSSLQMTSCLLWARAVPSAKNTFISKLVTEILQQAGLVGPGVDAHSTSPSALHRLLQAQAQASPAGAPPLQPSERTAAVDFKVPQR